ncbi:MAG: hypothetical protein JXJ04_20285 [Spirochaetales bacterium]|nr:hypothetical protein [Spirochaetales bacterium]
MKAIVCTKYGPPEVLQMTDIDTSVPGDNEVSIKIYATSVTVDDSRIRGFRVPNSFWLPARLALGLRRPNKPVLGSIFAGEVDEVGKCVSKFKRWDKVFGSSSHNFGAYAEYICISHDRGIGYIPSKR